MTALKIFAALVALVLGCGTVVAADAPHATTAPVAAPGEKPSVDPATLISQKPASVAAEKTERDVMVGDEKFVLSSEHKHPGLLLTLRGSHGEFSKLITSIDMAQINAFLDGAADVIAKDERSKAWLASGHPLVFAATPPNLGLFAHSDRKTAATGETPVQVVKVATDQVTPLDVIADGILRRASSRFVSKP